MASGYGFLSSEMNADLSHQLTAFNAYSQI